MSIEKDDVGADIAAAMSELSGEPTTPAPEPEAAQPELEDKPEPKTPGRDAATGKFTAPDKDKSAPVADEKHAGSEPEVKAEAPRADTKPQGDAAPATWRAEAKAEWEKLPPSVKAEIAKREQDFSRGIETKANDYKQVKAQLDEIEPVIGPRRAYLTANYGSVGAALKRLTDISDFAGQDPVGFVRWFSAQQNIDLKALSEQPDAPQVAPEVLELKRTITGLSEQLNQLKGNSQQTQLRSMVSEFDSLEKEVDATGNPVRPFWSDVRDSGLLGPEISIVRQEHPDWSPGQAAKEAYDRVVWKHSDTRAKLLTQREQQANAAREAKERADAAKNARKSTGGSPPVPVTAPTGNPREDLQAEIAEVYNSVVNRQAARL